MKAYGIYRGSIYEGGGSDHTFYEDKETAIKKVEELVSQTNKEHYEMFFESDRDHYESFKLKKRVKGSQFYSEGELEWDNGVNEICLIEIEIICQE